MQKKIEKKLLKKVLKVQTLNRRLKLFCYFFVSKKMNSVIINLNLKKVKGMYKKSEIEKPHLFYDNPSTSSQDIICNRVTDTSKDVRYPNDRYVFSKNIGDGSASTIYIGFDNLQNKKVIIKKIKKNEYWRKELEVLKLIKDKTSDKILKLVDFYETQKRAYIITEYYTGFDLFEHIDINSPYPEKKGLILIREMAKCIKECHDNGIIHLDIKCENYMVNTTQLFDNDKLTGKIVLIDFGHAEYIPEDIHKIREGYSYGTVYYLCPEGFYENFYSSKSDIWSLGICMSLILTGDYPFLGSEKSYYNNSLFPKIYLSKKISEKSEKLLHSSLNPDSKERPNIDEFISCIDRILG
jgi:serine/threonine protein kinase